MNKRIGLVLSGAGNMDGSEIHEAVFSMLALDQLGVAQVIMAPETTQKKVMNHLTREPMAEARNVLVEAARIARGNIVPLGSVAADSLDGLVIPGGFGAALNLSSFATDNDKMVVSPQLEKLIMGVHTAQKPIAAICIAPMILAKILGPQGVLLTLGDHNSAAKVAEKLGAKHQICGAADCVVDLSHKIVTTPAYMLPAKMHEVYAGISKAMKEVVKLSS